MKQPETTAPKPKVAVQLYSVRTDCARDLPGTLKAIAALGYEGVEFAGYHGYGSADLRRMLDDLGLKVAGSHLPLEALLDNQFEATVAFNQTLGNRYLIVPGLPPPARASLEAWKRTAETFNRIAERLRPLEMRTGYHNHHVEFQEMDGVLPWKLFLDQTSPDVVIQADTGNALRGGADVIPWLERYPGRARTIHLKEYDPDNPHAELGEGRVHWSRLFRVCESTGQTEWYIVEQESYRDTPMECIRRCRQNLRKLGR